MQGDSGCFNDAAALAAIRQVITRAPLPQAGRASCVAKQSWTSRHIYTF